METAKRTLVIALLFSLIVGGAYAMEESAKSKASESTSETHSASCMVKITADASVLPLHMDTIDYLLNSSAVAGKAARDVLGVSSLEGDPALFEITIRQMPGPMSRTRTTTSTPLGLRLPPPATGTATPTPPGSGLPTPRYIDPVVPQTVPATSTRSKTGSSTLPGSSAAPSKSSRYRRSASPKTSSTNAEQQPQRTAPTKSSASSYRTRPLGASPLPQDGRDYGSSSSSRYGYNSSSRDDAFYNSTPSSSYSRYRRYSSGYDPYYGAPRSTTSRTRSSAASAVGGEQTLFFRLDVTLTEKAPKLAAREFMNALVKNLREAFQSAFDDHHDMLDSELGYATRHLDDAREQIAEAIRPTTANPTIEISPANAAVNEQFNEIVDLSALNTEMPISEAIDLIKHSVDPPLKIVVLWRDLLDKAEIEPTSTINMDGLSEVRLGTALSLLLKAAIGDLGDKADYSIADGVITIASEISLPREYETRVYDVPGLVHSGGGASELATIIQETIEPDSWHDNSPGEGTIKPYLSNKLVVRQTAEVHQKIQKFLRTVKKDVPIGIPPEIPAETLFRENQELHREKRRLEMETARLQARHQAIEQGIARITTEVTDKLGADPVTDELEKLVGMNAELLNMIQTQYRSGEATSVDVQQANEKLARAKIDLAKRREELSKSAGGDQLEKFTNELTSLTIDLTEKTAELQVIDIQLQQTQSQLAIATTFDPQVSQMRFAKEAFEAAQQRISTVRARLTALAPPTVTIFGVD